MRVPDRTMDSETVESPPTADEHRPRRLRWFVTGLVAGCYATVVMSTFRIPISRSPPPTARFWATVLGDDGPEAYVGRGLLLHLLYGTTAGGVFGAVIGPKMTGSEATRERNGTLAGTAYGLLLSAFGVHVLLDRLLNLELEDDERFVFHVSHVVYGIALGTFVGAAE